MHKRSFQVQRSANLIAKQRKETICQGPGTVCNPVPAVIQYVLEVCWFIKLVPPNEAWPLLPVRHHMSPAQL